MAPILLIFLILSMRYLFGFLLFSFFSLAYGQNELDWADIASISWRTSPFNNNSNKTGIVNFNTYSADIKVPVSVGKEKRIVFGFDFSNNSIQDELSNQHWSFSHTGLRLIYQTGNENKKWEFMLMPKFSSTFTGGIDIKDFQLGAAFFRTKIKGPKFRLKYGAYFNQELFGPMLIPMFGFDWLIAPKWRFKLIVPLNLELAFTAKKNHRFGLLFIGANASYRMRQQLNPFTLFPNNYQPYLDKADNNVWLFGDVFILKNLVFNLRAGHSVLRRYAFYDDGDKLDFKLGPINIGNDRFDSPTLFKDGWSFEFRVIFRVQIKKPSQLNPEGNTQDGSRNTFY